MIKKQNDEPTKGQVIFLKTHGLWRPGMTLGEANRAINEWADLHTTKYKD